jgi:serine/threonine-protein kinase
MSSQSSSIFAKMAEDVFGIVGTTQAGAYRVESVVAEGGFAVVYRAHHEAFRAKVALKCLKVPDSLGASHQEEFLERFREEGELLFRLSSGTPAVVRPLHVGILDTKSKSFVPFIALEWLEGQTLEDLVSERVAHGKIPPFSLREALALLTPVARALERAHRFPGPTGQICILHRDLKPENFFIAEIHGEKTCKILDFGIGKVKSVATQIVGHQSSHGDSLTAFTPAYGAPEQWLPKRFGQTGAWTDVWGLALTLLYTLTGRAPFEGDQAALLGSAIDPVRRPTPRTEGVDVSDSVERIFEKAVAVDPRDRYGDVGLFWTELHRAANLKEGSITVPPPADNVPTRLAVSIPADAHAATKPFVPPATDHEVPDLELAPPPAKKPATKPAQKTREQHITLSRENDERIPSRTAHLRELDDDFERLVPATPIAPKRASFELDGVGVSPRVQPVRAPIARYAAVDEPESGLSAYELRQRLRGPVKLVFLGIVIGIGDYAYTEITGELLRFGPAGPMWLAGPLVILGIGIGVARLMRA